jgi:hypothetical protein
VTSHPRILLLHGIGTDGSGNVDDMGERLSQMGHDVVDVALSHTAWYSGRSKRIVAANVASVAAAMNPGDHVVAHSNGCRLAFECMEAGLRFGGLFFFSAALDDDVTLPFCRYDHLYNFHNPRDAALFFGALLPGHRWGRMGRWGYKGKSLNETNIEHRWSRGLGHSHWFESPHLEVYADLISRKVRVLDGNARIVAGSDDCAD